MFTNQMNHSTLAKIIGTLVVTLIVCSPAEARQSRIAVPTRTNAVAPSAKPPVAKAPAAAVSTAKTAAVTTSKTIAPIAAATPATTAAKVVAPVVVVAPAVNPAKVVAPVVAPVVVVAPAVNPAKVVAPVIVVAPAVNPAKVVAPVVVVAPAPVVAPAAPAVVIAPANPADSKTILGATQAGKTPVTTVATIARPTATSTAVDAIAVATTGPLANPAAPLSIDETAKAVAALAAGTMSAADFTAALAGAGTEPVVAAVDPAREIWAATWEQQPSLQYVFPMVWLRWPMDKQPIYENNIERYQSFFPRVSVPDVASIKGALSALPPGRRALFAWHFGAGFFGDTTWTADNVATLDGAPSQQPSPWCESALELARTQWTAALSSMKTQDVNFDFLVLDNEQQGIFNNFNLMDKDASGKFVQSIVNDPRADEALFGLPALNDQLSGVDTNRIGGPGAGTAYLAWNNVVAKLTTAVLNEALWTPAKSAYPNLKGSNYEGFKMSATDAAPDWYGHAQPHDNVFGSSNSPICYGVLIDAATAWGINSADPTRLVLGGSTKLPRGPWSSLLMDVQTIRSVRRSGQTELCPWISTPVYAGGDPGQQLATPLCGYPAAPQYHDEMIRHLALAGSKTFLVWNSPSSPITTVYQAAAPALRLEHANRLNELLRELNTKLGGFVENPLATNRIAFNSNILVSGAQAASGRYVWRVSVKPGVTALSLRGTTTVLAIPAGEAGVWFESTTAEVPVFDSVSP